MESLQSIAGWPADKVLAIARSVGWGAADILQSYYQPSGSPQSSDRLAIQDQGDGPVTAADVAASRYILSELQTAFGNEHFGYLSEETYKTQPLEARLNYPWLWLIDPLDGTKDFINRTGEYAVHIALIHAGRPVLAVVVCPERGTLYSALLGQGAFRETRNGETVKVQVSECDRLEELAVVASGSHRGQQLTYLLSQLPCQNQRSMGSIGYKIAAIVEHEADLYISISGKSAPKDWDLAAPELILTEAGGQLTRFDGTHLQYNQVDVNQWGELLASNGPCHQRLCTLSAEILAAESASN